MVVSIETCDRCRRSFGGTATFRRAHPRSGCRRPATLRKMGMYQRPDGVWCRRGPTDPGQLKLPLFGRGRPRKDVPSVFFYQSRGGRTYVAGLLRRGRRTEAVALPVAEAA